MCFQALVLHAPLSHCLPLGYDSLANGYVKELTLGNAGLC